MVTRSIELPLGMFAIYSVGRIYFGLNPDEWVSIDWSIIRNFTAVSQSIHRQNFNSLSILFKFFFSMSLKSKIFSNFVISQTNRDANLTNLGTLLSITFTEHYLNFYPRVMCTTKSVWDRSVILERLAVKIIMGNLFYKHHFYWLCSSDRI
jgi:hypothetical protein